MDKIDWILAVRGASAGFTVLVISGLLNPIVTSVNQLAGLVFLVVGALAASVLAAWRARAADSPVFTGAIAALVSYTLVVPLIYLGERKLDFPIILGFGGLALVVGAITGAVLARRDS